MYMYYSSGWVAYVLLLLKLITYTHLFIHQIFLKLVQVTLQLTVGQSIHPLWYIKS